MPRLFGISIGGSSASQTSFSTIQTDAGTYPVATGQDVLTLTSSDILISGNSGTDTVTFSTPQLAKLSGATFTGFVTLNADPTAALHAATKQYADALANGLKWKVIVVVATTADITLSGTQTIDGVGVIANDRVLVKDQTDPTENGIYDVAAGAWSRSTDADTGGELELAAVAVDQGTVNSGKAFRQATDPVTIGVSDIVFANFLNTTYSAGTGLTLTGTTFSVTANTYVEVAGDTMTGPLLIEGSSDALQLKVKAHSTQTSNLIEIQNSSATVLAHVSGTGAIRAAAGTVSLPGLSFNGATADGWYSTSSGVFSASAAATKRFEIAATTCTFEEGLAVKGVLTLGLNAVQNGRVDLRRSFDGAIVGALEQSATITYLRNYQGSGIDFTIRDVDTPAADTAFAFVRYDGLAANAVGTGANKGAFTVLGALHGRGRTADNTKYALYLEDSAKTVRFRVRNDGMVHIGGAPYAGVPVPTLLQSGEENFANASPLHSFNGYPVTGNKASYSASIVDIIGGFEQTAVGVSHPLLRVSAYDVLTTAPPFVILNNGKVIIGAIAQTNPATSNLLAKMTITANGSAESALGLYSTQAYSSTPEAYLSFGGKYNAAAANDVFAYILGRKANATDGNRTGVLFFATNISGTVAERMRIDDAGSLAVGVGASADASARVQVDSTTKGFLPPRMTTTQKNNISSPAAGLIVYDTTLAKLCVYTTAWETVTST